jgi:hypothetical protein
MSRLILTSIGLLVLAIPTESVAAQSRPLSPVAVAGLVLLADSSGDPISLLRWTHPEAVSDYKASELERLRSIQDGSFFAHFDHAPPPRETLAAFLRYALTSIYRVASLDELAQLSPDTVFVRGHAQVLRGQMPPSARTSYRPVGAVLQADTLAYVVVLERWPDQDNDRAVVLTFRLYEGEWRSLLDGPLTYAMSFGWLSVTDQAPE